MRIRKADGTGKGLLSYFTRHNTIANLLLVLMVVLGVIATGKIRSQFFPDVVIERISVSVSWPGAGPSEVDNAIVELMTPVLLAVEGIEEMSSTASEGSARFNLSFDPGWDMDRAVDDVKTAVDSVQNLPDSAEDPNVSRSAWRDRVTDVVISGPVALDQLGRFADEFSALLYAEGITRTTVQGLAAQTIRVTVSELSLIRNDISLLDISGAIAEQTRTNPAGDVAGGASRLRTGVENRSPEAIERIVLRSDVDGAQLLVQDVGDVTVDGADSGRAFFQGTLPAVLIRIDRSDQGDAIEMQARVETVAAQYQEILPQGTTVKLINARSSQITDRLDILLENGLTGLGLVLLMLYLFLGFRTAFWVAAGIPVAMLAAIALMYAAGLTLNMISLFALIITLGIVVDDAIVVAEHADFRRRTLGETPTMAAENAARRMSMPVLSSTITTILAFYGLVLIGGRFGALISDIPFTVIVVLMASLAECFLILPNHMRHALAANVKKHWYDFPSRLFDTGFRWMRRVLVKPLLKLAIILRYPVLAGMILLLAGSVSLVVRGDVTWRFFSSPEQSSITGNIAMLPGATRDDTIEMVQEAQRAVQAVSDQYEAEYGIAPIVHILAQVGGTTGRGLSGQNTKDADQLGSIDIGLIDADLRPYTSFEILAAIQEEVRSLPMLETLSFRRFGFGPGGDSLDISLYGADAKTLKAAAEALKAVLARYPEVSALEDSLAYDKAELVLQLTPLGESLGFTTDDLGSELRNRLNGIEAATFPDGLRSGAIRVEISEADISDEFLNTAHIRSPSGAYVALSEIVSVESSLGFSTIQRDNGLRLIRINGDISEDDPERAAEITAALSDTILPDIAVQFGVEWQLGGLAQQEKDFLSDALVAFTLCMLGIYLTLAWVFASWTRPMVVMAIIPLGLIGTIWGHYIWEIPMSMYTVIGLLGMSGIIINDAIVLVSTIQEYARTRGMIPAVIDATSDRLRPLMLTTLTTVLGLAPLLYETSQQAQFLKPTVVTLCYGLGVGFFIVLFAVPALVIVQQDIARLKNSMMRMLHGGNGVPRKLHIGVIVTGAAMLAVIASTVGSWVFLGELPTQISQFTSALPLPNGGAGALVLSIAGSAAILVLAFPVLVRLGRRRTA
ncbi:MAG: efflux RND transporter permease subunit [Rhodobacteraceae bacterium]|nr:efflux RND transporter permease subunit [Paracoccaceae bacterium]